MTPDEAWTLIEQDLIPSCREDARTEFYEMLANIWAQGYGAGYADGAFHPGNPWAVAPNPYSQETN